MAEEEFLKNIVSGELTNENFDSEMKKLQDTSDKEFKFDKDTKVVDFDGRKYDFGKFLKSRENFITEKLQDSKGVTDEELKKQATKDLIELGIVEPVSAQIDSLSESYKKEYAERLSTQPVDTTIVDNHFPKTGGIEDQKFQESKKLISGIIGEPDPQPGPEQRQRSLEDPQRQRSLEKSIEGLSKDDPKLKKGFKKMVGEMTLDELVDELEKRQKKTTNIEEKGICQRMREYAEKVYEKTPFKIIGLAALLAFLGYEFLNTEIIAGTGCMVTIANVNTNCRAMDFTLANQTDPINECKGLPALCQDPVVPLEGSNPPVNCQPNYSQNPIKIDSKDICSQFCNSKYLIGTIKNNSVSYNCEKCDLDCAFRKVFQVICNIASDLGSDANDLWEFLKKWGFYIIIVIAIVFVIYLITKVIQGAREIKHILYDTETGQTKTISSHDDLASLLANKEITFKPSIATKFRSKK